MAIKKPKRKYQTLYSGLFGPSKSYIDDVPMYGPKKPDNYYMMDPEELDLKRQQNAPINSPQWYRDDPGEISPAVQNAIDRAMKNKVGPTDALPGRPNRGPKREDNAQYLPPVRKEPAPYTPTDGGIVGMVSGEEPYKLALVGQKWAPKKEPAPNKGTKPQTFKDEGEEETATGYGESSYEPSMASGSLMPNAETRDSSLVGLSDRFSLNPYREPEPNIAGVEPDTVSVVGPEIPEGTVTSDTKEVRARIRDARDQRYTPRDILSPQPSGPGLTPKWDNAKMERVGDTRGYGEQLPPMYKNDPKMTLSQKRYIDEQIQAYRDRERLPDKYDLEENPAVHPREYVSDAERYLEPRPDNWKLKPPPEVKPYDRVSGGQRFGEPRPKDYEIPDYPDLQEPERVSDPERYEEPLPEQMPWRPLPDDPNYDKVDKGQGFDRPLPTQRDIDAAPGLRERDMSFERLGTPDSVGRMRDRVWRPNIREADYTDIKGPDKMALLRDPTLGKFNELSEWDKGNLNKPFVREQFQGDKYGATRAGIADMARSIFTKGVGFQDAAGAALGAERDRREAFEGRQDQKEAAYGQLQQAERGQRLAEQQFKYSLQKAISDQGIQIRGQDLDYIKAGAALSMQEFQTRLTERMGHNADKLRFNEELINEAQNFNQADQNVQAQNINARQIDQQLKRDFRTADNNMLVQKAGIQQEQDRADFDRWAKSQDLNQEQYARALNAWSLEQQAHYGQQTLGVDTQKFNVQVAQKKYDQALSAWAQEESAKDARFGNALANHQEGRATLNDYQILKQKQEQFNSTVGQEFQQMLQQEYRDVSGVANQKARFGLDSWQAGQGAEEQYQQRQIRAAEFNVGTDMRTWDQRIKAYDSEMGFTSQNFNDALRRFQLGQQTEQDYQLLKFAKEKQNVDQGNIHFNQKVDVWKERFGQKDRKLNTDLNRWTTGQGDHYKQLEEKRLRFGLNADEKREYDKLGLQKWKIEQDVMDTSMNTNLRRYDSGKDLYKFESEEERQRNEQNNQALYRADANALNKYGHDITLWDKYNKLPSDIRKDEAMADHYMNWYAQEEQKDRNTPTKQEDPLKMVKYYDNFNKDWTSSQAWKDYEDAGKSFDKIVSAPPTGFGDMSAIYGFIKSIDPKTGVREGERDFAISAMGWFKTAREEGWLDGMPSGLVRKANQWLSGELMTVDDREELANAAMESTNVTRNTYYDTLAQHEQTWDSVDRLKNNKDRIRKLPDYFGEHDRYGNKLKEPAWKVKLRDKYKNVKKRKKRPQQSNPWGPGATPTGQPQEPIHYGSHPKYNDPNYDPSSDFNKYFPDKG